MARHLWKDGPYEVKKTHDDFIVVNNALAEKPHSHFDHEEGCRKCIKFMKQKTLPRDSIYMLKACLRLAHDERHKHQLEQLYEVKVDKLKNQGKRNR